MAWYFMRIVCWNIIPIFHKFGKMSQNVLSDAVVIGALKVKYILKIYNQQ